MQRALMAALAASLWLTTTAADAGVYSTAEPMMGPGVDAKGVHALPLEGFRLGVNELRSFLADTPSDRLTDYRKKTEALKAKVQAGTATLADQINLSAYLIWLGKFEDAVHLLEPLARDERNGNFMVLSNLATANQMVGQPERAIAYLQQARDFWPDEYPGFTKEQLKWFQRADRQQLRLLLLRKKTLPPEMHLDPLFGEIDNPVKFVGEKGGYEPGNISPEEKKKLPPDALATVQQLALWLPVDNRLYWQVGEVLNAEGNADDAKKILDDSANRPGWDAGSLKELLEHRRILQEWQDAKPKPLPPQAPSLLPSTGKLVMVGIIFVAAVGFLGYLQIRQRAHQR